MIRPDSVQLSKCHNLLVIDEEDQYAVQIDEGPYQLIVMGFASNKPAAKFEHPNILGTAKKVHEFKHYRKDGGKFWTSKAGVNHYLVIPRDKITMLPEKGYSYVPAEINGVKVTFNVSGGTNGKGWTDYLRTEAHISVNHKLSDLKKLLAVAVRVSPFESMEIPQLDEERLKEWHRLDAKANPKLKERICQLIESDKNPMLRLVPGLSIKGSPYAISVYRRYQKKKIEENRWQYTQEGAVKSIIAMFDGMRYSIKVNQIDWHETAKINGVL